MDWAAVVAGAGGGVAIVGALGVFARDNLTNYLKSRLESDAATKLAQLNAALARVERLESELLRSRGESYGEIWTLTGALNLFGPTSALDMETLSDKLTTWYFAHGWLLTDAAKDLYFLVQEVLNFAMLRSLSFRRPDGETLYGGGRRPVDVLRDLRKRSFGIDPGETVVDHAQLAAIVDRWKLRAAGRSTPNVEEEGWILFQWVMSTFRAEITEDLGSRLATRTLAGR
jgi:hypothetical protein